MYYLHLLISSKRKYSVKYVKAGNFSIWKTNQFGLEIKFHNQTLI